MTVTDINKKIIALWREHFGSSQKPVRWPLICPEPVTEGLTVVGCNPALPKSQYYTVPFFQPDEVSDQLREELIKHEVMARESYPYYRPLTKLAMELKLPMEHVDLFFYRVTSQKQLVPRIKKADGTLNDFGKCQIALADRLIVLSRPRMILVANAFAALIFKNHFGLKKHDDDGIYWLNLNGRKTPVFLSGMLSGSRRLDNHSLERLIWHMRRALAIGGRAE